MKKQVGMVCGATLLALYAIEGQARMEAATAVLLGSLLLAIAMTIRNRAPKV
jgi:hypothetical protein